MTEVSFHTACFDDVSGLTGDAQLSLPWWSFGKTVIATAALKLVEQGHLKLDEPINNADFTLRQLLQHRAGLTDYGSLKAYHEAVANGDEPWSIERLLHETNADKQEYKPGQGWRYSNISYLFVRQIIEETTGQELGKALHQLVFNDIGLDKVHLALTKKDLEKTGWGNAAQYDPGWVYHGLLIGSPSDAVVFFCTG